MGGGVEGGSTHGRDGVRGTALVVGVSLVIFRTKAPRDSESCVL